MVEQASEVRTENSVGACLDQRIFVGISKEMKTLERETSRAFGTKENNISFPPEHCASFTISQENKTLVRSLVSASFAKSEVSTPLNTRMGCITIRKEPGD